MELCNQLNYVRSLSSGKAYFYYLDADGKMAPISIDRTHIRAPKSGYSEGYTGSSFQQKNVAIQDLAFSNPQYVEQCYVPPGVSELCCAFSLRINANSIAPEVCSKLETRKTLEQLASLYCSLGGFQELGRRYAKNILLGTWLWRNEACRKLAIEVTTEDQEWRIADARHLEWFGQWDDDSTLALDGLTEYLATALSDPKGYFYMDIRAKITVGWGDEVYPSQEFLEVKEKNMPTKRYATVALNGTDESVAFHAQKVGAAIQCIDNWWTEGADRLLRVNEYGADRQYAIARRHPSMNNDFYSLIRNSETYIETMLQTQKIPSDVHFMMAVLVKGGLFNCSSSNNSKRAKRAKRG